jgi:hypothetical protein
MLVEVRSAVRSVEMCRWRCLQVPRWSRLECELLRGHPNFAWSVRLPKQAGAVRLTDAKVSSEPE